MAERVVELRAQLDAVEDRLREDRVRRRSLKAALRVLQGGKDRNAVATAALVAALKKGARTVAELHAVLERRGFTVSASRDANVQRTVIRTILHRQPLLFRQDADGRWTLA